MNDVRLYINGREIDIDKNTDPFKQFLLNFEYRKIDNPVTARISTSYSITLPATPNNNDAFNHIYNLDQVSVDFDHRARNPFVVTIGGNVVESGAVRFDKVVYQGREPRGYEVLLLSSLIDFFGSIRNKYLEDLTENMEFADKFKHNIDAQRVKQSWTDSDYYKYILSYSGQYNNFENDKRFTSIEAAGTFKWVEPSGSTFVAVGDKVRGIAEDNGYNYISSETNFNFNKIQKHDSIGFWYGVGPNNTLAYTSEDDATGWVSKNIPASYGDVEVRDSAATILADVGGSSLWIRSLIATDKGLFHYFSGTNSGEPIGITASQYVEYPITSVEHMLNANLRAIFCIITGGSIGRVMLSESPGGAPDIQTYYAPINGNLVRNFNGRVIIPGKRGIIYITSASDVRNMAPPTERNTGFRENNYVDVAYMSDVDRFIVIADNGNYVILSNASTPTVVSSGTITDDFYYSIAYNNGIVSAVGLNVTASSSDYGSTWTPVNSQITTEPIPDAEEHQRNEFRSYYQRPCIRLKHLFTEICNQSGYEVVLDPAFFNVNNPYWEKTWIMMDRLTVPQLDLDETKHGNIRTGDEVTFELMVKNGVEQSDIISSFCLMFGLLFEENKIGKKVYIWDRKTFFSQHTIEDWTEKIDYNLQHALDPIAVRYKYGVIKYTDSGTQYETDYREKYNRPYGRLRVDTGYNFNNNESELLTTTFQNIVISQDYDLYFEERGGSGFAYRDDKILPAAYTKKNNVRENTDLSMVLLFDAGMQDLRETARLTDDTFDMETTGLYSWNESEGIEVNSIPLMLRVANFNGEVYSLDFARPEEVYYHIDDQATEYPDSATIYARYWENYLSERLNKRTRVYTAWFYLDEFIITQFRFNKFVVIENVLWHVNSITNYNPVIPSLCKVELIRVYNINNYLT